MNEIVRIRFWQQETQESGRWLITEPMYMDIAQKLIEEGIYDRPEIIDGD